MLCHHNVVPHHKPKDNGDIDHRLNPQNSEREKTVLPMLIPKALQKQKPDSPRKPTYLPGRNLRITAIFLLPFYVFLSPSS